MIVKNEAAVLRRCLASVKPYISHWVICDTGSTDGTQELARRELAGIPGEMFEDQWIHFGHNRTLSMQRAAGRANYHLLLDADMVLNVHEEFRHKLESDAYLLGFEGENDYHVVRLVSDRHHWEYKGATHEFVYSPTSGLPDKLREVTVKHFEDGGSRAEKYERDITLLKEEVSSNTNNARAVFYLAQSYRDAGHAGEALKWYFKRTGMGGWNEEVWYSLYMIGWIQQCIGTTWPVCLAAYLQAFNYRPTRLEPIYQIAKFYREHKQYTLGLLYARLCQEIGYPDDCLFIERKIYEELLPREYEICCRELGYAEAGGGSGGR